jgi:hypothetical protein
LNPEWREVVWEDLEGAKKAGGMLPVQREEGGTHLHLPRPRTPTRGNEERGSVGNCVPGQERRTHLVHLCRL